MRAGIFLLTLVGIAFFAHADTSDSNSRFPDEDPDKDNLSNTEEAELGTYFQSRESLPRYVVIKISQDSGTDPYYEWITDAGIAVNATATIWKQGILSSLGQGYVGDVSLNGKVGFNPQDSNGNYGLPQILDLTDNSGRTLGHWTDAEIYNLSELPANAYGFSVLSREGYVSAVAPNGLAAGWAWALTHYWTPSSQAGQPPVEYHGGVSKAVYWDTNSQIHTLNNDLGLPNQQAYVQTAINNIRSINSSGKILGDLNEFHPLYPDDTPVLWANVSAAPVILTDYVNAGNLNETGQFAGSRSNDTAKFEGTPAYELGQADRYSSFKTDDFVASFLDANGNPEQLPYPRVSGNKAWNATEGTLWIKSIEKNKYVGVDLSKRVSWPAGSEENSVYLRASNNKGPILAVINDPNVNAVEYGVLIPVETAPKVLRVNSDFDEQKIDPATTFAKSDNGDDDLKAERGPKIGKIIIDDLHKGFWGVNPNTFPPDFYQGANVTITKKSEIDEDTGRPESGTIRLYAIKNLGVANEQSVAIPISEGSKPTISSGTPKNLVTNLYNAGSVIPKGDDVTYFIEGVDPGKVTLEFKYVKGNLTFTYEQKFNVVTQQSKQTWQEEIRDRIKLQTNVVGDEVDVETHHAGSGLNANVKQVKAIYAYYQQLYLQHENKFMWAGMARTASASIYAAMADVTAANANGAALLAAYYNVDFEGIEVALLYGQKLIYDDLAWQHRAYEASGIEALKYVKEDLNEDFDFEAWEVINVGILDNNQVQINAGNRLLLDREQTEIVVPAYDIISGSVPEGSPRTVFNWFAENPMPGGPPIQNVVQNGDITNTDNRWEWIDNTSVGMLAIWNGTSNATYAPSFDAAERKALVEKNLQQSVIDGHYLNYAIDVP